MQYAGVGAEISNAGTQLGGVVAQSANMQGQYGVLPSPNPQGMPASTLGPGSLEAQRWPQTVFLTMEIR